MLLQRIRFEGCEPARVRGDLRAQKDFRDKTGPRTSNEGDSALVAGMR